MPPKTLLLDCVFSPLSFWFYSASFAFSVLLQNFSANWKTLQGSGSESAVLNILNHAVGAACGKKPKT